MQMIQQFWDKFNKITKLICKNIVHSRPPYVNFYWSLIILELILKHKNCA